MIDRSWGALQHAPHAGEKRFVGETVHDENLDSMD